MICIKCGNDMEKSECNGLECSNNINLSWKKCTCKTCKCNHKTPSLICNKCVRGIHTGEI